MNRKTYIKIFGMLAAIASGVVALLAGDYATGAGIIAASLSSANLGGS